jgi:hypothetical protein
MSLSAFDIAAKHLFRHLHDPNALRKNSLVGHLFDGQDARTAAGVQKDRSTLSALHEQIQTIANCLREHDAAQENATRANRRHAIVVGQLLGRRPIGDVASELSISSHHCYRERAAICHDIAVKLAEMEKPQAGQLDDFRLRVDYARYRASYTSLPSAKAMFGELISLAPSPSERVEALYGAVATALELGDIAWATRIDAEASRVVNNHRASSRENELARARVDLIACRLAAHGGMYSQVLQSVRSVAARLEPLSFSGEAAIRELHIECLIEASTALWVLGDIEAAYDLIADVHVRLQQFPEVSRYTRSRVCALLWKARSYLVMSAKAYYPAQQRLSGLLQTFHEAYAAGSIGLAVQILVLMTEHHVFAGTADQAVRTAQFALFLAEQHSALTVPQVSLELAVRLLSTQHRSFAITLASGTEHAKHLDAYHRSLRAYFEAENLIRRRRFNDAFTLATADTHRRGGRGWATIDVRNQLVAARAAFSLGQKPVALDLITDAICTAERLQAAPILRDAYRIGQQVSGDPRFGRQALDVSHLLAS